ncbi:MAG: FAD-dependent oxidoreductase [Oscillospiraceae bacterium]|jgi:NAD(P)H-nitrite reductase large subunit|nr:FAD-dependent oxidoreductase [Oscillospiraceae bacterium]
MKHVIIGNSTAAVGCVEGIRRVNRTDDIVLIADESHHTYARPLISYLLAGKTDKERMKYRKDDFYEVNGVTSLLGKTAVSIDPAKNTVTLDSGEAVGYDNLLVATGASPVFFPAEGLAQVKPAHTFTTLDDADALLKCVRESTRVLIVGAGLIGLKCAEGLRARTTHVAVVDLAPIVLSSMLKPAPAEIMQAHLEQNGVELHLGTSVKAFRPDEARHGAYFAELQNGESLGFDVLVYAAGVRANIQLVKDAGGACGRGITVDAFGQTSLPQVYAAGDCTESTDVCTGQRKVMALLPNAYMQGEAAGMHMAAAGAPLPCQPLGLIPENAIGFFGKHILSAGVYFEDGADGIYEDFDGGSYRCFYYDKTAQRLRGYILMDCPQRAGIYTALIRNGTQLPEEQFLQLRREPGLIAFPSQARIDILRKKEVAQ